jgi:hypothetical protein
VSPFGEPVIGPRRRPRHLVGVPGAQPYARPTILATSCSW